MTADVTSRPKSEREQKEALRGHWPTSVPDHAPNDNPGGSLDDVASGRRLTMLVVALALVGAPAIALRAFCVGQSCAQDGEVATAVPFCSLPADLRAEIEAGYRQGRSPDVMATTNGTEVAGGTAGSSAASWPLSPLSIDENRVPIIFFGHGVTPGELPRGTGVDRIAPTLARLIGYDRPHPEIRSGTPIQDAARPGADPPLVVEIVWRGVGSEAFTQGFAAWTEALASGGDVARTFWGTTGSLPVEPATTLTTIGTGGLPFQHGITGNLIRDKRGAPVPAWSSEAPTSVIAALPDDWDHATGQRARIGLIAPDPTDQGLVGGTWFLDHDRDDLVFGRHDPVRSVERLLRSGYGVDDTTDVLGVVLTGSSSDAHTRAIVEAVHRSVPDATFVITASGWATPGSARSGASVARSVDRAIGSSVVAAAVPGGLFLDQAVMAANDITSDDVVRAMDAMKAPDGTPLFADAYPGFAISFSRYC